MEPTQLRMLIEEVLIELGPPLNSPDAVELLLLTAAQESHLGYYIVQVGNGPAKGIFQMESATAKDIWKNFLKYKPDIARSVDALTGVACWDDLQLKGNLLYQIAMARVHYYRRPEPLPSKDDHVGMAEYWKKHYNTHLGKGTIEEALKNYRRLVLGWE